MTFKGYLREDGSVGTRNNVVILTTVGCANGAVVRLGEKNPDVVTMLSVHGCGNCHMSRDYGHTVRDICMHPNTYATVIIGLGCEPHSAREMCAQVQSEGKKAYVFTIQRDGGSDKVVEDADKVVKQLVEEAKKIQPVDVPLEKLAIGLYSEDDKLNDKKYNKALGMLSDWILSEGGSAVFTQTRSFVGAEELVKEKAGNDAVAAKLDELFTNERFQLDDYYEGKFEDFKTKEEVLENLAICGSKKIDHVLTAGTIRRDKKGLIFIDGTTLDTAATSNMIAAGAQIEIAASGKISMLGFPTAPVVKVCTGEEACKVAPGDADILAAGKSVEEVFEELKATVLNVINGGECIEEKLDQSGNIFEGQYRMFDDIRPTAVPPLKSC